MCVPLSKWSDYEENECITFEEKKQQQSIGMRVYFIFRSAISKDERKKLTCCEQTECTNIEPKESRHLPHY